MVAGWGAYQWSLRRAATQEATPTAVSAAATAATKAIDAAAPALEAAGATPAPAPPVATSPAPPPNSGPTLAQLTAARLERDAAIEQRDAANEQVRQLREDLARGRTTAPPTISATDGARLAQLQRERDTLRYVAGSKKLLMAQKVIESHLYLLPPPPDPVVINVSQTTEITLEATAFGLKKIKDVQVIPSSVWEDTDFKVTITGTTAKFTILKPESFRTFAKYFVILVND
jgi:hypothetical protein